MLFTVASWWAGRGGLSRLIPLLAAAAVFTTRNGPRDGPHNRAARLQATAPAAEPGGRAGRTGGLARVTGSAYAVCVAPVRAGPVTTGVCAGAVAVTEQPGLGFAELLRQLRAEAGLTQEELAEVAGLSPRSVSDLERGIHRTAHKDTAGQLADALGLAEPSRALFVAAARGRGPAADVLAAGGGGPGAFAAAATRALPRDVAAFTGREAELARLMGGIDALAAAGGVVGIHAVGGMAGVGKTTFAVHAAHRLAGAFPDGQFFLPLHAHTAGQRPVDPADALASLLLTAGVAAAQIPPGLDARAGRWRDQVADKKILLLLDDAAGHEQVRPLLPGSAGSLVLVTSRRRLTALPDATVISLDTLPPGDAAQLLARLAGRPDLGSTTGPGGEITRLCGYLPLAVGMVASQLRHHPAWPAAGLAADLAAAKDRLALMYAENLSVAAAFDLSYADLTAGPQRLFRRLGLVPGPNFDRYAAAALDGTSAGEARRHLGELYDQHLIIELAPGRYELHDLLREHARALAAAGDPAGSRAAAGRLLDYYLHTVLAAGRHIPTWATAHRRRPDVCWPGDAPDLSTLGQAGAWLEAERPNLRAAVGYAAGSGRHLHAMQIPAAMGGFHHARGHWDQAAALYQTALTAARQAGDQPGQAGTLHDLGVMGKLTGDYTAATASLAQAVALYGRIGDRAGQAYALCQQGTVQRWTGNYSAALASLEQALELARGSDDQRAEACALQLLSAAQLETGDYLAPAVNLARALDLYRSLGHRQGQAQTLRFLGILLTRTGDYPAAGAKIRQALKIFGDLGDRPYQAWTLNDLGMVQQLTGDYPAAAASHQHALELLRDLGERLGQAEALNHLGELLLRISAAGPARDQHIRALAIARDLGACPEEARALKGIGNSHLHDGNPGQATEYLRQALAIYQRIGAPAAQRVQEILQRHRLPTTPDPPASGSQQQRPPTAHTRPGP
jgi:tetratricopeptide (TPR) repeat protein/transcriptional regulator with XRE-family HTH domain